jgi:hypothetical protein
MIVTRLLPLLILTLLGSCNPKGAGTEVKVNTEGVYNPISLSYNGKEVQPVEDMGEYLLGTNKKVYTFKVRNNSLFPLTNMTLKLNNNQSAGFNYNKNLEGVAKFPGHLGNCGSTIPVGGSCDIMVQFDTSMSGQYDQDLDFIYENLVESANRKLKIIINAGNPGSLVFKDDINTYWFGSKVGLAQTPVVERADTNSFQKVLEVTNTGDLNARDINILNTPTCVSRATGICPSGQNVAYSMTHDCPKILTSLSKCFVTINFAPKNQEPAIGTDTEKLQLSEVKYDATIRLSYLNTSEETGNTAALNAFFTSTSSNIEAKFETSLKTINFETPLVVGTRQKKSIRVNNRGFREGKMAKFIVFQAGAEFAHCVRGNGTEVVCYKTADLDSNNRPSYSEFPFYFKDLNQCLGTTSGTDGAMVQVDNGCQFEIYFQPSVSYKTNGSSQFELKVFYDSQWKGLKTDRTASLFTSKGDYNSAARIVPVKVSLAGSLPDAPATSISTLGEIKSYQLGRMGMMSGNSFVRKTLTIKFKNEGGTTATALRVIDGQPTSNVIPNKENVPDGVSLYPNGSSSLKSIYDNAKISTNNCTFLEPLKECDISIEFAPIAKTVSGVTNLAETQRYMFDEIPADPGQILNAYKKFQINYTDGSSFLDGNRTEIVDAVPNYAEVRLKAQLVARGLIADLVATNFALAGGQAMSKTSNLYFLMTNIGTNTVRYMGNQGSPWNPNTLDDIVGGKKLIASDLSALQTKHSATLNGALVDCLSIIDFNYVQSAESCSTVDAKIGNFQGLAPDQTCAITMQVYPTNYNRSRGVPPGPGGELFRNIQISDFGTERLWDYQDNSPFTNILFDYYDNDLCNPLLAGSCDPLSAGNLRTCYGGLKSTNTIRGSVNQREHAKIHPHTPLPQSSAVIYRQGITLPTLLDPLGAVITAGPVPGAPIPATWFVGKNNFSPIDFSTASYDPIILRSTNSTQHFPGVSSLGGIDINNYEFAIHLGTFPQGKAITGGFSLANMDGLLAVWQSYSSSLILRPGVTAGTDFSFNPGTLTQPTTMLPAAFSFTSGSVSGDTKPIRISFKGMDAGVYASEFIYRYTNGGVNPDGSLQIVEKKILVVAEAMATAPDLTIKVASYVVETNGTSVATTTPTTPSGFGPGDYTTYQASYGDEEPVSPIAFQVIKSATPTDKDFFVKKQILIQNTSGADITDLSIFGKDGAASHLKKNTLDNGTNIVVCLNNKDPYCKGSCGSLTTLQNNFQCYVEVFFRPNTTQSNSSFTLTLSYKLKTNQYITQNINLSFEPKEPARALGVWATEPIRVNQGVVSSYPFNFGTMNLNSDYQRVDFADDTTFRRLKVTNASPTRASFLRAWHLFKNKGTTEIPTNLEYDTQLGGEWYIKVGEKAYTPNGIKRLEIYANESCMVGDNTPAELALPNIKRGFNNLTASSCFIAVIFRPNINYQNIIMDMNLAKTMEPNFFKLQYYDNDRSSWNLSFHVHVKGRVVPNGVTAVPNNTGMYQSVQTNSAGQATITWQAMIPRNSLLGDIIAYRLFYNTSETILTNILGASTTSFFDVNVNTNTTGIYTRTISGLTSKVFYFFKIIPIRQNSTYNPTELTNTAPFANLTGNRYLSDNGIAQLTVAIPPTTMFYDHSTFSFISREPVMTDLMTFSQAKNECAKMIRAVRLTRSGTSKDYKSRLITESIWGQIVARPTETNGGVYNYSLWLDHQPLTSPVLSPPNIHTMLLSYAGYNATLNLDYFLTNMIHYVKAEGCGTNCPGNKAVGTIWNQPDYQGWVSLVSSGTVFAAPRCHVKLACPDVVGPACL